MAAAAKPSGNEGRMSCFPKPLEMAGSQLFFYGNCGSNRAYPKKVVPTAMARVSGFVNRLFRHGLLGKPRKGIELGEQANNRLPTAVGGNKSSGDIRNTGLYRETGGSELVLEQFRAFVFLITDLG